MTYHKKWVAMLLVPMMFWLLLSPMLLTVSAEDSQKTLLERMEESLEISVFYQKEPDRIIKRFDVNEDGWFAIGYGNNTIQIYDSQGNFQYGYRFDNEGTYGITLNENNIVIYLARGNFAFEIDPTGKCIRAEEKYSSKYINEALDRTSKQIGNVTYSLERDIGFFDGVYPRLVKTDATGTKTILHDVTIQGYFAGAFQYILIALFPIGIIYVIKKKIDDEDRRYAEEAKAKEKEQQEQI